MEPKGNPCWDHHPPPNLGLGLGLGLGFHHDHNNHNHNNHNHNINNRRHNFHSEPIPIPIPIPLHINAAPPDDPYPHFKPPFPRKRKFDFNDASYKLFVGGITRTVTQHEIQCMFEEHGKVIEVVMLHDKQTGQHQEYCFVKYASIEEADRAIAALHNQLVLPGATVPLRVRYADGERERLGLIRSDSTFSGPGFIRSDSTFPGPGMVHKVYVNGLNKEASKEEILEIFSSFGVVVDVYIMRNALRQSRGCGFVGFSQRHMAIAAIHGLDGTYTMRGCDHPLEVRVADPKKPKNGELRFVSTVADVQGSNWPNPLRAVSVCSSKPNSLQLLQLE